MAKKHISFKSVEDRGVPDNASGVPKDFSDTKHTYFLTRAFAEAVAMSKALERPVEIKFMSGRGRLKEIPESMVPANWVDSTKNKADLALQLLALDLAFAMYEKAAIQSVLDVCVCSDHNNLAGNLKASTNEFLSRSEKIDFANTLLGELEFEKRFVLPRAFNRQFR